MKNTAIKFGAVAFSVLLATSTAFAASDGNIGTTSTGTSIITVTIPKLVRARSFADYTTASYAGTGDINQNDDLNISKNYTGTYRVTATTTNPAGAFNLSNGTQTIAFVPSFNDATGVTGAVALTYGTPLTGQTGSAVTLAATTLNANLSIAILEANLQAVDAGTYTNTLSVLVAPE